MAFWIKESTAKCFSLEGGKVLDLILSQARNLSFPGQISAIVHHILLPFLRPANVLQQEAALDHGEAFGEAVGPLPELGASWKS